MAVVPLQFNPHFDIQMVLQKMIRLDVSLNVIGYLC